MPFCWPCRGPCRRSRRRPSSGGGAAAAARAPPGAAAAGAQHATRSSVPRRKLPAMAAARPKVACSPATVDEIRRKFAAFQYLEAGELVDELRRQLAGGPRGPEAVAAARELTRLVAEEPRLEERVAIARQALVDLTGDGSEWIVDRDDEIRMQHKMDAERYFSVRVESVLEGVRPADCLSIWREVSLYPEWFPLVTKGAVLSNVHPFEAVLHVRSPSPSSQPPTPQGPPRPRGATPPIAPIAPIAPRPVPKPPSPIAPSPKPLFLASRPSAPPMRAPRLCPPVPACARRSSRRLAS